MRSERSFFFETGKRRHCAAGRLRNRRICQITKRLRNVPPSAISIIGMRIRSWCRPRGAASVPAAAARAPTPMRTRTALIAMTAGHNACSTAKRNVEMPRYFHPEDAALSDAASTSCLNFLVRLIQLSKSRVNFWIGETSVDRREIGLLSLT